MRPARPQRRAAEAHVHRLALLGRRQSGRAPAGSAACADSAPGLVVRRRRRRRLAGTAGEDPARAGVGGAGQPVVLGELGDVLGDRAGEGVLQRGGHLGVRPRPGRRGQRLVDRVADQRVGEAVPAGRLHVDEPEHERGLDGVVDRGGSTQPAACSTDDEVERTPGHGRRRPARAEVAAGQLGRAAGGRRRAPRPAPCARPGRRSEVSAPRPTSSRTSSVTKNGLPSVRSASSAATSVGDLHPGGGRDPGRDRGGVEAGQLEAHRVEPRQGRQRPASGAPSRPGATRQGDDDDERHAVELGGHPAQQAQALGVGPVHVVEDQQRPAARRRRAASEGLRLAEARRRRVAHAVAGGREHASLPSAPRTARVQPHSGGHASASQPPRPERKPAAAGRPASASVKRVLPMPGSPLTTDDATAPAARRRPGRRRDRGELAAPGRPARAATGVGLAAADDRPRRAGRREEIGVLAQDDSSSRPQLGAGVDAQLLGQVLAGPAQRCRARPPAGAQRYWAQCEQRPQPLPQRVLPDQLLQLGDGLRSSRRTRSSATSSTRGQPQLVEPDGLGRQRREVSVSPV